jgi:predicted enzyme related to lactoylglutathione lyase
MFMVSERPVAGMMKKPEQGDLPPFWLSYINVSDVNAMRQKAIDNGAEALTDVVEIPNMRDFAVIKDPTGATFALGQGAS